MTGFVLGIHFRIAFFRGAKAIFPIILAVFAGFGHAAAQNRYLPLKRPFIDDINNFTNVGNIGLTVTNFGIIGEGYNNPDQPSCLYKLHSDNPREQVEHFSYGGLWVGGKGGYYGGIHVSTAIVDGVFDYGDQGFEFTTSPDESDTIITRSTIITSRYFDPSAVSHQDFICDFTDTNTVVPGTEIEIPNHTPLGITVHLESYAWNYSYADAFVILNYTIKNVSPNPIEDIFVALWVDASVGNMNYTSIYEPGGGWTWYDNLNGFDPENKLAYQYDADGDDGFAESYLGIRFLGASIPTKEYKVYYNQWKWSTASSLDFPDYVMPVDDEARYATMQREHPYSNPPDQGGLPDEPDSWMILLSAGPLGTLMPGDSLNFAFAVVCGRWATGDLADTPERRRNLILNSQWAQRAFNGEDVDGDGKLDVNEDLNGNGQLDEGEDLDGDGVLDIDEDRNGNGIIDRYILPSPPPSPNLLVVPENQKVTLYWDNLSETVEDPITREIDFEGYRIYSAPKTAGSKAEYTLLAQFDKIDDLGYDTGFEAIRFDTTINGHRYHYRFVNDKLLNGWPNKYFYAVTAFDKGNPANNLPSLESSILENKTLVIPGTPAVRGKKQRKIGVYPNPYRAQAAWDGPGERERMIWFTNLPPKAEIRIYTLAGDLVDVIYHDAATYDGAGVRLLEKNLSGNQVVFSGGEHAWDLITQYDQAVATGLYLFTVEDLETGEIFRGKFLIIK